jgi:hypothetical protein
MGMIASKSKVSNFISFLKFFSRKLKKIKGLSKNAHVFTICKNIFMKCKYLDTINSYICSS